MKATSEKPAIISVVVPVAERYDDLSELYRTHAEVLKQLNRTFEFLFVLDGGFAEVQQKLEPLIMLGEPIRIIRLPRIFGESTAIAVGCEQARGEIIIILSAYFQVVPEGIAPVLRRLEEGYDFVVPRRFPRVDTWFNQMQTRGFHFLIQRLTGVALHDISCGLKGMYRRVIQEIPLYGDLHRFLPVLAYQRGFCVTEVDVPQHPAAYRTRVYAPGIYLRRFLDILTLVFLLRFTKKPLRFFGLIGTGLFGTGFIVSLVLTIERLLGWTSLADRPLLILGVLLMVLGVQVGSIGLLGEMITFTHAEKLRDYQIDKILE